ncbi:MAG: hypothetical protein M0000_08820 [Actinomycetota bacterium]|nr:hypothetical protein [Actinomycetota bacterium]MDA8209714.1 hypothetical protein [Actinomycetota bacterium]
MARATRIMAVVGILGIGAAACGSGSPSSSSSPSTASQGTTSTVRGSTGSTLNPSPSSSQPANPALVDAITKLYTAEAVAKATYNNVVLAYGEVGPFATIAQAEGTHLTTLAGVAKNHGVTLPSGPFTGAPAPAGYTTACQLGVTTEQNMIALYNQYIPQVTSYADATTALKNLLAAEDNHLTAFQRC